MLALLYDTVMRSVLLTRIWCSAHWPNPGGPHRCVLRTGHHGPHTCRCGKSTSNKVYFRREASHDPTE